METVAHLILMCNFAKAYWRSIGALVVTTRSMPQIFDLIRRKLGVPFFMDIIILMFWSIWTVRNNWVFDGQDPQCIFASKSSCLNSLSFSRAPFLCCILLTPPPPFFNHIALLLLLLGMKTNRIQTDTADTDTDNFSFSVQILGSDSDTDSIFCVE
jgi:hypothetical protein